jgi:alpha,alpha-trehalase
MDESQSSLIATPFPFVIAGGRFREFYYWDSLWITEGLLLSGMTDSAIHMLNNFAQMINKYGYVPNGARIYYQGRS